MLIILFVGVILAGLISEIFSKKFINYKSVIITFSVSIVLALICIHILPEIFISSVSKKTGLFILLGFLLQILLELMSKGIEHGHVHYDGSISKHQLLIIFLGLSIHSFIEGIPLNNFEATETLHQHNVYEKNQFSLIYFLIIIVHKLPIAAILIFFLNTINTKKTIKFTLLIIFAATSPLGALFGKNILGIFFLSEWSINFLAISTGMLLHITTVIIFEDHHNSKNKIKNILTIAVGITTGILLFSF